MSREPDPLFLGIEIGGTKLQLGLGRGDGRPIRIVRRAILPRAGATGILRQILDALPCLIESAGATSGPIAAAGIGFGGPVESDLSTVVGSHQVEGWAGFDLGGWVRSECGVPRVTVQNDADTAGLGEARFGAGAGLSPVFYATIGSGIGGGLIVDGRIYRGSGRGAAEVGHLWVHSNESGPRRLEDVASGWSIGATARARSSNPSTMGLLADLARDDPSKIDAQAVATAARRGDALARSILDDATRAMGQALGHVVTLLAPRRIILGGGVSLIEDGLWLDPIRRIVGERTFPPFRDRFDVVTASLGEDVVVFGALALARSLVTDD